MRSASAMWRASGFSQMTSRPCLAAPTTSDSWVCVGVQTSTASTPASAYISSASEYAVASRP